MQKGNALQCNGKKVNIVVHVEFLGIKINVWLNRYGHINDMVKRLNSVYYEIKFVIGYMDSKTVKIIMLIYYQ